MKIIDLLNKIANGEQPKTIKYQDDVYEFGCYEGEWGYVNKEYCRYKWFANEIDCDLKEQLNDEVEIIEDKKIEKFKDYIPIGLTSVGADFRKEDVFDSLMKIGNKINEIIDVINKGDK